MDLELIHIAFNGVFGVLGYLMRQSINEKSLRIQILEKEIIQLKNDCKNLEVNLTKEQTHIEHIKNLLDGMNGKIEKIIDKLVG